MENKWCEHIGWKEKTSDFTYRYFDGDIYYGISPKWTVCPICGAPRPAKKCSHPSGERVFEKDKHIHCFKCSKCGENYWPNFNALSPSEERKKLAEILQERGIRMKTLDFKWFGDLLRTNFPEYMNDFEELRNNQTGVSEEGVLLQKLKEEAGEIPENTCADIERVIKGVNDAISSLCDLQKQCGKENDAWDYSRDAERAIDDLEPILEKLRDENTKLRELGTFWYEKFKQLLNKREAK